MTPAGAPSDASSDDPFGSLALKIRGLLGLPQTATALVAGTYFEGLRANLAHEFASVTDLEAESGSLVDLAALDLRDVSGTVGLAQVAQACRRLSPSGYLWVIVGRRAGRTWLGGLTVLDDTLRRAGWQTVRTALPVPSLDDLDEYWDCDGGPVALPASGRWFIRIANRLGWAHRLHPEVLVLATRDRPDPIHDLSTQLVPYLGPAAGSVRVTRFALRPRGATVLILEHRGGAAVARVAHDPQVAERLRLNAARTESLHSLDGLAPRWRQLVPKSIGRVTVHGVDCTIESHMRGVLAWKLAPSGRAADRAEAEAVEFLTALAHATGRNVWLDDAGFHRVIGATLEALASAPPMGTARASLLAIDARLRQLLVGRTCELVLGHGDFGFGNLLVDSRSGALTGVIDWDTAVEDELAGVDRANLLMQRATVNTGGDIAKAFEQTLPARPSEARIPHIVAAARLMGRSLTYPNELRRLATAYRALVDAARAALD